jgi:hypothetical protein
MHTVAVIFYLYKFTQNEQQILAQEAAQFLLLLFHIVGLTGVESAADMRHRENAQ